MEEDGDVTPSVATDSSSEPVSASASEGGRGGSASAASESYLSAIRVDVLTRIEREHMHLSEQLRAFGAQVDRAHKAERAQAERQQQALAKAAAAASLAGGHGNGNGSASGSAAPESDSLSAMSSEAERLMQQALAESENQTVIDYAHFGTQAQKLKRYSTVIPCSLHLHLVDQLYDVLADTV